MTYVAFLWNDQGRDYLPEHVNILARAITETSGPSRIVCITSETEGFCDLVEVMPVPEAALALSDYQTPEGEGFPSCYRRLWLFSEAAKCLGDRIMLLDIDIAVTGDLRPLLSHPGTFCGVRSPRVWGNPGRVCGGSWALQTGSHSEVWEAFSNDPLLCMDETRALGWRGSDQAIISRFLSKSCSLWPSGIHFIGQNKNLPEDAKLVHFNGHWHEKPWNSRIPWVKEYVARYSK